MIVLIVDDDPNKTKQLSTFVGEQWPTAQVRISNSFNSGMKAITSTPPDVVLLDMTMPTYDVSDPDDGALERRYAGEEILRQIRRRKVATRAIVVTQFERFGEGADKITLEELEHRLNSSCGDEYLGVVFYRAGGSEWRESIRKLVDILVLNLGDGR